MCSYGESLGDSDVESKPNLWLLNFELSLETVTAGVLSAPRTREQFH